MALYSQQLKPGDRVLVASTEYGSNYIAFLQLQKRLDISVEVIPDKEDGTVSLDELKRMLDEKIRIVSVTHVPATSGRTNPIEAIGEIVASSDALYVVDATQSVGHIPLDVSKIKCDVMVGTAVNS
jgi:selenocysteine lyase/cysteine desulfurase